jgi:hypothetical protein
MTAGVEKPPRPAEVKRVFCSLRQCRQPNAGSSWTMARFFRVDLELDAQGRMSWGSLADPGYTTACRLRTRRDHRENRPSSSFFSASESHAAAEQSRKPVEYPHDASSATYRVIHRRFSSDVSKRVSPFQKSREADFRSFIISITSRSRRRASTRRAASLDKAGPSFSRGLHAPTLSASAHSAAFGVPGNTVRGPPVLPPAQPAKPPSRPTARAGRGVGRR